MTNKRFSIYFHNRTEENARAVILSAAKIHSFERILSYLKDAETGVRGYAMSGESCFLESYNMALPMLSKELNILPELLKNNKDEEQIFFKDLKPLIEQRLEHLKDFKAKLGLDRKAAIDENVATRRGKILMDSIRAEMDIMVSLEKVLFKI